MQRIRTKICALCLAAAILPVPLLTSYAAAAPSALEQKKSSSKSAKKSSASTKKTSKAKPAAKKETSASVKKQEAAVKKEIKLTQQQIEANEKEVTENLAVLSNLAHDIDVQKGKISSLEAQERSLLNSIASHEQQIKEGEANLASLRERYVAAVKKMRVARKKVSPMAFVFASKSFYQAWRRMRYMHKFAEWRGRKETEIKNQIAALDDSRKKLADGQKSLQLTLNSQREAQNLLTAKHKAQDETVAKLRASGDALRSHLSRKQAEANDLNNRISNLIAAEQEEARLAEQRRVQEQARREAERKRKEQEAAERAERQRIEAEKAAAEQKAQAAKAKETEKAAAKQKETPKKETPKKEEKKKTQPKKEQPKKQQSKKEQPKKEKAPEMPAVKNSEKSYAEARGRRPRSKAEGNTAGSSSTPAPSKAKASGAAGFAAAKGSLPRPVSGQFSIVSHFGRHSLANMKDVMYDNPGIDAVVANGASAQAVYDGTVTGVYVLDGFSTVVIINHGEYYTVYGHIGTPTVKKGDKVKQGQALGHLVSDPDEGGRTLIHFEVWKNREKQNPEAWIR